MKKLQKGFSLVELLVVVAIIGVLAGVGIVGYQSYTDSAKNRVAVANFGSVKRFVETELTLLNNNIQTVSGALSAKTGGTDCGAGNLDPYTVYSNSMAQFIEGMVCYFDTNGYGNAFKNPYDAAGGNQVGYKLTGNAQKKGMINIRHVAADGDVINGQTATTASYPIDETSSSGYFVVEYFTALQSTGGSGEYKAKLFTLK